MGLGRWAVGAIDAGLDARAHVLHAVDLGRSVHAGVGRASWGMSGLARETAQGRHTGVPRIAAGAVSIGNSLFHGDGDRTTALDLLARGFDQFEADMLASVHANPDDHGLAQWWAATVSPAIEEWRRFASAERSSYLTRFATSWDTFEQWRDRLVRMRENARVHGIALGSAEPQRLPQTFTEQGSRGAAGPWATLWTCLKLVLYAAVGIAGFIGLYQVYRDVRYGHMSMKMATLGRLTA